MIMPGNNFFGVPEPDEGAGEPTGQDPTQTVVDGPPQGNAGGEGGQGDPPPGQPESVLSKFTTNEEVENYILDLESRVNESQRQLDATRQQKGKDQIIANRAPQQPSVDDEIKSIVETISEEVGPKAAEAFDRLMQLRGAQLAQPINNRLQEMTFDRELARVEDEYPDYMQFYDQLIAKASQPGYANVKLLDLCRLVIPHPPRSQSDQAAMAGNSRVPQNARVTNADMLEMKRRAQVDVSGGNAALPDKTVSDQNASQLLERALFGKEQQDRTQKNFFGVR